MRDAKDNLIKKHYFAQKLFDIGFTYNEVLEYCDRTDMLTFSYWRSFLHSNNKVIETREVNPIKKIR